MSAFDERSHTPGAPRDGSTRDASQRRLQIYLSDHRGGAAAGLALARRCAERNRGTPLGSELAGLVGDIAADVEALEKVARALDVRLSGWKQVLAALGERVARLKLNGQLRGYSPLSQLLELEGLLAGIDAKRSLWVALCHRDLEERSEIGRADLDRLVERAEEQRRRLVPHHRDAARRALRDLQQ